MLTDRQPYNSTTLASEYDPVFTQLVGGTARNYEWPVVARDTTMPLSMGKRVVQSIGLKSSVSFCYQVNSNRFSCK